MTESVTDTKLISLPIDQVLKMVTDLERAHFIEEAAKNILAVLSDLGSTPEGRTNPHSEPFMIQMKGKLAVIATDEVSRGLYAAALTELIASVS